jgi:predicted nucleotidyltransferase component of viral defense system
MHKAIKNETKRVLEKIAQSGVADYFYLAGGTALAMHLGHRESIDLDFFSDEDFLTSEIKEQVSRLGNFELTAEEKGTVHGVLDGVRVSFLKYRYSLLFDLIDFEKIKLADERDIVAMKIDAISSRGSKKDFIDVYFLLEKYSLNEMIGFFEKKYSSVKFNKLHILKSLTYFEDAEKEPMPVMIKKDAEWLDIKNKISNEVKKFLDF